MREILFRGKQKDNGEWVYGDFTRPCNIVYMKFGFDEALGREGEFYYDDEVIPETVGQYTGLTDKNGNKIFEGDIVSMPAYGGGKHITNVYFKGGKFAVNGSRYYFKDIGAKTVEVIGNIHDNPELLGVKQ